MSITMLTTGDVVAYLQSLLPAYSTSFKNGFVDRATENSIGVLKAPSTRSTSLLCIGGIANTPTMMLPVNIHVRWGKDTNAFDVVANAILVKLIELSSNITLPSGIRVVEFKLLDGHVVGGGRDIDNVCEGIIRVNIEYYI